VADFASYYQQIYAKGMSGETPPVPVSIEELERRAEEAMEAWVANYVFAGAGGEGTMEANREAFRRRRIVPRMLARDVADRDLTTTVLGTEMPAPLMLAPIGVQRVVHPEGELATARAAAAVGVPMIASTASHHTLEEIAAAGGPEAPRWFQLYWPNSARLLESFVGRAEAAGYGAIVVTVDAFIPGWKPRDLQQARLPFLEGMGNANYMQDPVFLEELGTTPEQDFGAATGHYLGVLAEPSLGWDDLARLRELTALPILVKGIQHPDDAREAVARGVDGIVVSNHGGRQVGGAIGSLDALPAVAEAVGGRLPIVFDSGVRSGTDVLKALALGADVVCLGRPYLWGLALDGADGVEAVLRMVLGELELSMALCGYTRPDQLGPDALA
jgi:isopentenyl diphosphate isomerase/L-lactate dehydrogenase-like FMN-dependent dehydrogenase